MAFLKRENPDPVTFRAEVVSYADKLLESVDSDDQAWAFQRINNMLSLRGLPLLDDELRKR
ncbi:hypothetical protein [Rhodanobacter sp. A1T4]|uniref:hypothetical protein n=1 Tax=Rhodanobacter sp. A1T4 TaxID=2723087 RepID=UPI00161D33E5|nr:hypothetical protein [Rhodanobacter sp. A1T4]MBB6249003.1 hypothetical protein [Rhodanobacter sp. A1T4]